jgi:hypothetical protein
MSKVNITENEKTGAIRISVSLLEDDDMHVVPDENSDAVVIQMPERKEEE